MVLKSTPSNSKIIKKNIIRKKTIKKTVVRKKIIRKNSFAKKAVVFSMISFLISTLFISIFLRQDSASIDFLADSNVIRITNLNDFINSYDLYIQDAMVISTISVLNNLTDQITNESISQGTLSNPEEYIPRCLIGAADCQGMNSFDSLLDSFEELAEDLLGITASHSIIEDSVSLEQNSHFYLEVSMQVNYTLIDPNFAYWSKLKFYKVLVPIVGLKDPLYEWNKDYLNKSSKSRIIVDSDFYGSMNATEFKNFVYNQTYITSSNSPSYLQRLSNLPTKSSDSGIESVLLPSDINNTYPINEINRSYADYQIFSLDKWSCADWSKTDSTLTTINISERPELPEKLRFGFQTALRYGFNETSELIYGCG